MPDDCDKFYIDILL